MAEVARDGTNEETRLNPTSVESRPPISGPTLPDTLFLLLLLFVAGDAVLLVLSAVAGTLSYIGAVIQVIILVPLVLVLYYFRDRRSKLIGTDFNI